jgi:hypothetical protein
MSLPVVSLQAQLNLVCQKWGQLHPLPKCFHPQLLCLKAGLTGTSCLLQASSISGFFLLFVLFFEAVGFELRAS